MPTTNCKTTSSMYIEWPSLLLKIIKLFHRYKSVEFFNRITISQLNVVCVLKTKMRSQKVHFLRRILPTNLLIDTSYNNTSSYWVAPNKKTTISCIEF